jgi:hypothetical protein
LKNPQRTFLFVAIILSIFSAGTFRLSAASKNSTTTRLSASEHRADVQVIPNKVVVKFSASQILRKQAPVTGITSFDALLKRHNVTALEPVLRSGKSDLRGRHAAALARIFYVKYVGNESPFTVADALYQDPAVEYAEPLYFHQITATPDDSAFTMQNHLSVIKAQEAWDVVKGEQGSVVIAIVDGGTDIDHPDIAANLWVNPAEIPENDIDDDNNGFVDDIHGWNFADNSPDPAGLPATPGNADHGTHTAGIAAAVTNNGVGVAGVSWNARLMAINVSSDTQDGRMAFSPDGILYGMENGADIISMSLGRSGGASLYEQDLINAATEAGAVVIAAAGNDANSAPHFPSSYDNVLSVAATSDNDLKAGFSSFGTTIDVSAPGIGVLSTVNNGRYERISGTSMSTPVVAGITALVKTLHSDWSGFQAGEQVRVTADEIDNQNPSFARLLGRGRVNALRAVTETMPSMRITDVRFTDSGGDGIIEPGETVDIDVTIKNYLAAATSVALSLNVNDQLITSTKTDANIASISTLEEITLASAFSVQVSPLAPSGYPVDFILDMSAGNYQDIDRFKMIVLPTSGNLASNNLALTITNVGRVGFGDPNDSKSGIGFRFKEGPNLLFEGAIMAGTGPNRISNAARTGSGYNSDFAVADGGEIQILTPGTLTDQESIGIFNDSQADNPMEITVTQETFSAGASPNDDFIIFRYNIENRSDTSLDNFHFGIFFDWDIDGENFFTNIADFDSTRNLGFAFDNSNQGPDTYVGAIVLTEGDVSYRAIYNDEHDPNNPSWGIYDDFTDAEKWQSISGGVQFTGAGPADISFSIGTGPFSIASDGLHEVAFALLAGVDKTDLQANADAAREFWRSRFTTGVEDGNPSVPTVFALRQNYPNPFNPQSTIAYDLPVAGKVRLEIFNIVGQRIRILVDALQTAGRYIAHWDGRDGRDIAVPSGIYLYRLQMNEFSMVRRMLLLK